LCGAAGGGSTESACATVIQRPSILIIGVPHLLHRLRQRFLVRLYSARAPDLW
jgi:hypothetical protein